MTSRGLLCSLLARPLEDRGQVAPRPPARSGGLPRYRRGLDPRRSRRARSRSRHGLRSRPEQREQFGRQLAADARIRTRRPRGRRSAWIGARPGSGATRGRHRTSRSTHARRRSRNRLPPAERRAATRLRSALRASSRTSRSLTRRSPRLECRRRARSRRALASVCRSTTRSERMIPEAREISLAICLSRCLSAKARRSVSTSSRTSMSESASASPLAREPKTVMRKRSSGNLLAISCLRSLRTRCSSGERSVIVLMLRVTPSGYRYIASAPPPPAPARTACPSRGTSSSRW